MNIIEHLASYSYGKMTMIGGIPIENIFHEIHLLIKYLLKCFIIDTFENRAQKSKRNKIINKNINIFCTFSDNE